METKTILSYLHSQLYADLIAILTDLTDQQLEYQAPQIDTRSIRDVAIHAYRPALAIACILAGEEWPVRPHVPLTKNELFALFQTMHTHIDECLIRIPIDKLEEIISLPWDQSKSGLEALAGSFMHGMRHIGAIQGIRACGGFPTPAEDPKPARGLMKSTLIDTILEPIGGQLHEWSSPLEVVNKVIDNKFGKYARPEVERKFLVPTIPPDTVFHADITDHYISDTTLRLRRMQTEHKVTFKLGQKLRVHPHDTRVIFHTNFYISEAEYVFLASTLPSHPLEKRRFRFHGGTIPMAIDQFQGTLQGLVIAEIDFGPHGDPSSLPMPSFALAEVTDDERFTGGRLALTTRQQVKTLLDEFNVK